MDQCIVCLENLGVELPKAPPSPAPGDGLRDPESGAESVAAASSDGEAAPSASTTTAIPQENDKENDSVALIKICGHLLHDSCLREWTEKANSCPICRQSFHVVEVYDKVGGTLLSTYKVEDKKQVAEFDPLAWLEENEEEESTPCPVCNRADEEEILLLCDGCDTPYHTHCIGLDRVPEGPWFCMECVDLLGPELTSPEQTLADDHASQDNSWRSMIVPRTQASMRRARRRARSDEWQGAWGQIASRVFDALSIDLDYNDDDDDDIGEYRRHQRLLQEQRRQRERWQQRLHIASRVGARDVFESNIPAVLNQRPAIQAPPPPPPVQETREERRAWGALERAIDSAVTSPGARKRKSRSVTASPSEPRQEPERKLKRPRTRRLPIHNSGPSSSRPPANVSSTPERPVAAPTTQLPGPTARPSFLSSLLKEVEQSTPSDDENLRNLFGPIPGANDPISPAASPAASGHSSPRATSITPPPHRVGRPSSPTLSLSSHIEPVYPPANYSPTRSSPENSDSEHRPNQQGSPELRQPRARRQQPAANPRSHDVSPARSPLPFEMKENISGIVRSALKPHWKSSRLTAEQYATINRDVSRKLYEGVTDPSAIDDEAKRSWEKTASKEVARAIAELKA